MSIVCVTLCVCMSLNLLHSHFASRRHQHAQASFVDFHNSGPYPLQTKEITNLAAGHNLQFYTFTGYLLSRYNLFGSSIIPVCCFIENIVYQTAKCYYTAKTLLAFSLFSISKPSFRSGLGAMSTLYVIQVRRVPTWTCIVLMLDT